MISVDIILASTSRIRCNILGNAGVKFSVIDSELDETAAKNSLPGLSADNLAQELAMQKSQKVSSKHPNALVIGADQVLGFKGRMFNKPSSGADAKDQLTLLRNETHTLFSAVSCAISGKEVWKHCSAASLTMRNFTMEFLDLYLNADPDHYMSSVGAYKLEETGIQFFEKIEGDYFTILGLPILPLLKFLREREIIQL